MVKFLKNGLQTEGGRQDKFRAAPTRSRVTSAADLRAHTEASVKPISQEEQRRLGVNIRAKYLPPVEE